MHSLQTPSPLPHPYAVVYSEKTVKKIQQKQMFVWYWGEPEMSCSSALQVV